MRERTTREKLGVWLCACRGGALALVLVLASACSSLPRVLETPSVRVVSLALLDANMGSQRFGVRLAVDNPNGVAIPIAALDFELRLGGEGVLLGKSTGAFTLPANGQEVVAAEITSDLLSTVSRLFALARGPAGVLSYELTGDLVLGGTFRPPLPFRSRGEIPLSVEDTRH